MPVLVDLINQVQKILPRRFGGTANDKGYASERLLLDFMNDTGSPIAIGSLVKLVAAFSDRRVTLTTDAHDRNVLGVVVGRRSTDIDTLGQFEEVAPDQYETVVVCVAGRCNVLITGSVTINQYAYPSSVDGTASGASTAVLGTIGRFDSSSSSSFASVILGRTAATTAPEFVSHYLVDDVTDMARLDFSSGFAVHADTLDTIAAIDLAYEQFELDAAQVQVEDVGTYYTGATTGTEDLRPTSDITASPGGSIVFSSGSTGWNLVDESVSNPADFYAGTNDAVQAWFIIHGFAATALTNVNRVTSVRFRADTDLSLGGSAMEFQIRDPQTGDRYDVLSFNPGSDLDTTVSTRPWDGRSWTVDDLRHLQAGFRQGNGGNSGTVYQFYATVDYTVPITVESALAEIGGGGFGGGVTDHGALTGLADDDHSAYVTVVDGGGETINTVVGAGASETIDLADGNVHDLTLSADCTLTLTGATGGVACSVTILLRQGTGGWDVTWPGSVEWPGGVTPTLDPTAGAVDIFSLFTLDGGTVWYGFPTTAGASPAPATTVTDETTWGIVPAVGTDLEYARQDHTHGSPDEPTGGTGGQLLISDDHSTPLVFADILQNDDQDDLLYADA